MTKSGIADVLPLSPVQEGMLFLALYDEGAVDAYTAQLSFGLEGAVDPARLRGAGEALLVRYPNLRAGFRHEKLSRPVQVVPQQVQLPWTETDLRGRSTAEQETALADLLEQERSRRFDLSRPPLLRCTLLRLADERYRLVLSVHHILVDGWSFPLLVHDLFELYARHGDGAGLPKVTGYRDYLAWLGKQDRAAATSAWRHVLDGVTEPTLLAPDGTANGVGAAPEEFTTRLPAELTARLTSLARARGWTMNTLVQGAWGLLLSSATGRSDVLFGATVSGRPADLPGVESMVGLFINTVPVRLRLDPAERVSGMFHRLQDEQTELMGHQHLGLTDIQELAGGGSLFDTLAVFENYPLDSDALERTVDGVRVHDVHGHDATHYPLSLIVYPGTRMAFKVGHRPDLVDRSAAEELVARLVRILEAVAADPDRPVAALELLSPAERERLLTTWNDTAHEVEDGTLVQRFERQAGRTPERTAVVFADQSLGYAELDATANRWAREMLARGVGPGDRVALAVPRSIDLVVSLLAVLKTGAAYLPVDPDHPAERIAHVLGDARPRLVLTDAASQRVLPASDAPVLVVDAPENAEAVSRRPSGRVTDDERTAPLTSGHPAYVIYTSGSTGLPKGVVVPHRGVVNRIAWMQGRYGLTADDRVLQKTPAGFDVSVWEFFWPLTEGAVLVVARPGGHKDPAYLADVIRTEHVTTAHFVPSMLQTFLAEPAAAGCTSLRRVVCSGEALPAPLRDRFFTVLDARLHNLYGPTEASVDVTSWECGAKEDTSSVPIGRPVWNTMTYVLDEALRPVAPGVPGDLYLAGVQLAHGYLGRPGLTAERFVADPHGAAGTRMYRTGDLARWRDDGVLEFLGRTDDQVKLRGFRVEPGEIESALAAHPQVAAARVVLRHDREDDPRLVAYAVPGPDGVPPGTFELRRHTAALLPDYMVPSAFVILEELPLTANGKLDRAALPAPETPSGSSGGVPRTPREEILAGLFAEVLGVPRVGLHDDFFALGGHSLLATRLVSRVRSGLGAELAIRTLFESPTVAGLAEKLAQADGPRERVRPFVRPETLPLSFGQRGQWFLNRFDEDGSYNILHALRLTGPLDHEALHRALDDVIARHESLRTIYPETDGRVHQVVLDDAEVEWRTCDVTEEELAGVLAAEAAEGFELSFDIPVRAVLMRCGEEEAVLLLVLHHIAADGWSFAPLSRDLSEAYRARLSGTGPDRPQLPVQYADFALWQQEVLGTEAEPDSETSRQLSFWKEQLRGLPEELTLPADRRRPADPSGSGGLIRFRWDAGLHQRIVQLARARRVSVFMVLQAGLAALLTRLGAGDDIPLGTPVAGRTDEALDDLVGFFVNTLVLRTDTSGDPTFAELLERVREADLAAYAHQDVAFERLVEMVNPERSTVRHPLFQVMLSLQNAPEGRLDLPGVEVSEEPVDVTTSKFDLALDLTESFAPEGSAAGVEGLLQYSADLFDRETAETLVTRLTGFLRTLVEEPARPIGGVPVLSTEERRRVLVEWNATEHALPEATLPSLFEERTAAAPSHVAVITDEASLTYGELNARANRLARLLIERGAGPERLVAVALPRTAELVVALLAVAKTGACYLPVDPDYPAERIAFMLRDAQPVLVLATTATVPADCLSDAPLVLDEPETVTALAAQPDADLSAAERVAVPAAGHAAYVIYTSGSTGTPKGVVVPHGALANQLRWLVAETELDARDVVLARTPVSFDAAGGELWAPLTAGAALALAPAATVRDSEELLDFIGRHGVTVAQFVPSLLSAVPLDERGRGIRMLLCGGEELPARLAAQAAQTWHTRVLNVYGPTEATIQATAGRIGGTDAVTVPLGRPVWNTRAYVLDARLQPVPDGVLGEVYLAGDQLARGYLDRPGLTAERFVADPFGEPGARLYRTGDLARRTSGGDLEYAGRSDAQVKLRGFRIELGEVESALASHPHVEQAAAAVRDDGPGRQLVGYVVPAESVGRPDSAVLRKHLEGTLPAYMVPAVLVELETLPLTASGKLDRAGLPAPQVTRDRPLTPPRTPEEEVLCGLFSELLGLDDVGVEANFFDLGGDSIISIQLVSRARKAGLSITPRAVFQHKTVEALAAVAGVVGAGPDRGADVGTGRVPLTPIIHEMRERGGPIGRFSLARLLRAPARLAQEPLTQALQAVLDHHDVLRTRLERPVAGAGDWVLEIAPKGAVPVGDCFRRVDVAGLDEQALAGVLEKEGDAAGSRIAPEDGRMFQVVWFDAGPDCQGRLLLLGHHLVVDGVSWRVLEQDLADAWEMASTGKQPGLQPVGTSFRSWAEHLASEAYKPRRVAELDLWKDLLEEPDELLGERPLDPTMDVSSTLHYLKQWLSVECTTAVLTTVPAAFHAGVNDVLLTAFALAVTDWRRRRGDIEETAVLVDLEGHGREEFEEGLDLSRTVGWFTSIFPTRLDPGRFDWDDLWAGGDAVGEVLKRVKEQLRTLPDNGLGYGMLRHLNMDTAETLADALPRQFGFNYLGRFSGASDASADWSTAPEPTPLVKDENAPMAHALELNALTEDELGGPRLVAAWTWPRALFAEQDVRELTATWERVLEAFVAHVEKGGGSGYTPSDLSLVSLSQEQIDELEDELDDEFDDEDGL